MHNKMIIHANDLRCHVFVQDGKFPLWKKGQGQAIHVSDFIVEQTGCLALSEAQLRSHAELPKDQQLQSTDIRELIYLGKIMMASGQTISLLNRYSI